MTNPADYRYDVFVSYSDADRAWVRGYLLPALGLPPEHVITPHDFRPGAPVVSEFERAVTDSRYTVLVFSPAYLADEWSTFSEQLTSYASVADRRDRLIPLLLRPCTLPLRVDFRVCLDCTEEANWEQEINRLRALLDQPEPAPERISCPYPGMVPFRAEDARFFYGRDAEIQQMLRHLRHGRYLFVIGPSGCGKSSLVSAGLLPKLSQSSCSPQGFWLVREMRPGDQPLRTLAQAIGGDPVRPVQALASLLTAHPPAQRLLLVIDQFEELFTQARRVEQSRFIAALQALRTVESCALLIAMRADFYSDLMNSNLWPVDASQRLEIAPLHGEALRQAIQQPAADVGVYLEAGLLERLLADAADEPGVLPMLQETLNLLWGGMQRRLLSLSAYERLGGEGRSGLAVAIAEKADATLGKLSPAQQAITRRIFVRLVQFGEDRVDTRRQQSIVELRAAGEEPSLFEQTLRHLTDNRLLTLSGEEGVAGRRVDIAHEALISAWPRLRNWLDEWREAERIRRRLVHDAEEWEGRGRDGSFLYEGTRLKQAQEWAAENKGELDEDLQKFLAASGRGEARRRAVQWFVRAVIVVFAVFGIVYAGQLVRVNLLRVRAQGPMVMFPAGSALFGTDDDPTSRAYPQRVVELPAFSLDKYEVTEEQYALCVQAGVCSPPQGTFDFIEPASRLPVVGVTAYQAAEFCRWTGRRLPTEAEWERATRGTDGRPWPWGDENPTPSHVNLFLPEFYDGSLPAPVPVDDPALAAGATPEGIMHLIGNVWEWTSTPISCRHEPYDCREVWDGKSRVKALYLRGQSWQGELVSSDPFRVTYGEERIPLDFSSDVGFRCAD